MDTILNESLSPEEMNALRGGVQPEAAKAGLPPVWPDIERLDPARLGAFLTGEHPQTSAMVVSKLSPQTAANVLLTLEKPLRNAVIRRMVTLAEVPEAAAKLVEDQLRNRVLTDTSSKDTSAGQARVASLLNEMDKAQLDEVMQDLEVSGTPDLDGIKARLFSFEDILQLSQKSRVALFDGLSTEQVTLALRDASPEMTEAVLSSIGARSRRMIEAELAQEVTGIQPADIVQARRTIASTAIRMSREGLIELPSSQNAEAA
jgi:flagellar motor switch protein FliG